MKCTIAIAASALLGIVWLPSCGGDEAPAKDVEVQTPTSQPVEGTAEEPVHTGLNPNPEMKESEHFTGRVVLREGLASGPGSVFVTVGRSDSPMPFLMKKYNAEGPSVEEGADGSRMFNFELTSAHNFMDMPLPSEDLVLTVRFDLDGYVETKVDSVSVSMAVEPGARDLEVILDQAPAQDPAADL